MKRIFKFGARIFLSAITVIAMGISAQELQGPNSGSSFKLPAIGSKGQSESKIERNDFHREYNCMRSLVEDRKPRDGTPSSPFSSSRASALYLAVAPGSLSSESKEIVFPHRNGSILKLYSLSEEKIESVEVRSSPLKNPETAINLNEPKDQLFGVSVKLDGKDVPVDIAVSGKKSGFEEIYLASSPSNIWGTDPRTPLKFIQSSLSTKEHRQLIHLKIREMLSTTPDRIIAAIDGVNNPIGQSQDERARAATNSKMRYDFMVTQIKKAICYCGSISALEPEIQKLKDDQRVQGIAKDLSCDLS